MSNSIVSEIRKKWPPRKAAAHKGDFGRVFILAGSEGYTGAAHLAAAACIRSGAGLVTLGVPRAVYPVMARREAEVMVRPFPSTKKGSFAYSALKSALTFARAQDVLAAGPGLSQHPETQRFVRAFLKKSTGPVVVDADGLNALAGQTSALKSLRGRAILTPHPGEFARLFGGKVPADTAGRVRRARQAAERYRLFVVLKGNQTVVAAPRGEIYVNRTGNPGMASGGTGDVLTGMMAAILGQGFDLWDAACFGVYLHGLAGDLAARELGQLSVTASALLDFLPAAFKKALRF